ncbi:MAG TPA: enoyl-CoA hydratase [Spirochaetota bacterium]|nr:enoyl-CoA hydratase [Spirochaetota bacterium]
MEQAVLFDVKDHIALITLNRPERRNSFNRALLAGLYDAIDEVTRNDDIRVAIITGSGKAFSSGIDLAVLGKENLFDPRGDGKEFPDIRNACRKPIIGAVNGPAVTGGFEIALNCDFLIATENAKFADTHVKVGIHPGWGMTQLLQQAVGQRMAKQMSLTGEFLSAQDALRCGLVNEIVAPERLLPRAYELAGQICAANQAMLPVIKGLIEFRNHATLDEAFANERKGFRGFVEAAMKMMGQQ